jgi:hypothetical protein
VGQFSLPWSEPAGLQRAVWKGEDGNDTDADRDGALDDLELLVKARKRQTRRSVVQIAIASQQVRAFRRAGTPQQQ